MYIHSITSTIRLIYGTLLISIVFFCIFGRLIHEVVLYWRSSCFPDYTVLKIALITSKKIIQAMFKVDPNRLNPLNMVPDITDYDQDPESLDPDADHEKIWNLDMELSIHQVLDLGSSLPTNLKVDFPD